MRRCSTRPMAIRPRRFWRVTAATSREGERVLAPLRAFGTPIVDAIQPMPFPVMQTLIDAAVPDGNQNYWKSAFLRELSDEAIDVIVEPREPGDVADDGGAHRAVRRRRRPRRQQRHGVRATARAVQPGHPRRSGRIRPNPTRHIAWTRGFADAMAPFRERRRTC